MIFWEIEPELEPELSEEEEDFSVFKKRELSDY